MKRKEAHIACPYDHSNTIETDGLAGLIWRNLHLTRASSTAVDQVLKHNRAETAS